MPRTPAWMRVCAEMGTQGTVNDPRALINSPQKRVRTSRSEAPDACAEMGTLGFARTVFAAALFSAGRARARRNGYASACRDNRHQLYGFTKVMTCIPTCIPPDLTVPVSATRSDRSQIWVRGRRARPTLTPQKQVRPTWRLRLPVSATPHPPWLDETPPFRPTGADCRACNSEERPRSAAQDAQKRVRCVDNLHTDTGNPSVTNLIAAAAPPQTVTVTQKRVRRNDKASPPRSSDAPSRLGSRRNWYAVPYRRCVGCL